MEQRELDSFLQVIENPVRRRIIKRLSQAPCYALQLSKELGLGQPLVAKHLSIIETAGLVTSTIEYSPSGPERKRYALAKSISITMDLAPNLFLERAVSFGATRAKEKTHQETGALGRRLERALDNADDKEKLSLVSEILNDLDLRMREVEEERIGLLSLRDTAMREAARIANKLEDLDKRRVLFHILDEHDKTVETISESLNLRELAVRMILGELDRDLFG